MNEEEMREMAETLRSYAAQLSVAAGRISQAEDVDLQRVGRPMWEVHRSDGTVMAMDEEILMSSLVLNGLPDCVTEIKRRANTDNRPTALMSRRENND